MKKINSYGLIVLIIALAFVSSCKKDDSPDSKACQISKMDITFSGMTVNSVITYNSANQVIDVQNNKDGEITGTLYSYNTDGSVSTMKQYEGASKEVIGRTEYFYDANGVTEEKIYADNSSVNLRAIHKYEYVNGKRSRKKIYNPSLEQTSYIEYTYTTNGDVSGTLTFWNQKPAGWVQSSRTTYTYNNKITDPFIKGLFSDDINFPATHYLTRELVEAYDPISQSWELTSDLDLVYTFDAEGNPTVIDVRQGFLIFNLTWSC